MHFTFLCNPQGTASFTFTPPDIWQRGVGGAELSLISLTETLAQRGHTVTVYNDPPKEGTYENVTYLNARRFNPKDTYDVFVLYRNPYRAFPMVKARRKLFFTTDQMTGGNYELDIYPYADRAIGISEFHRQDHIRRYGIRPDCFVPIDLGVRLQDYAQTAVPRIANRLIYCSVPHRGAPYLPRVYQRIKAAVPSASLVITGDYTLWGPGISPAWGSPSQGLDEMFEGLDGVQLLGAVPRKELVLHQLQADVLVYPHFPVNGLPELFGVSVAECMVAGCLPVITNTGALPSTVGTYGIIVQGDARTEEVQDMMADHIITLLKNRPLLAKKQEHARRAARARFDWNRIATQWETVAA